MPKGPKGEKRPADVVSNAVKIARIAVGEEEEDTGDSKKRKAGKAGAKARAQSLTPEQRAEIAREAANARWKKS